MQNLDKILHLAAGPLADSGAEFLLIGGMAVNHYGYTRNTLDVDFMIAINQLPLIQPLMKEHGFTNIEVLENVVFFHSPEGGPRIDFLQVDNETFKKLYANAEVISIQGHHLHVPSLNDLLAMKIFALSQNPNRRMGKDLPDIAYLTVLNGVDLEATIRPLCRRFGNDQTYNLIQSQAKGLLES